MESRKVLGIVPTENNKERIAIWSILGLVVTIGIWIATSLSNISTSVATIEERSHNNERRIELLEAREQQVSRLISDVKERLARIEAKLDAMQTIRREQ